MHNQDTCKVTGNTLAGPRSSRLSTFALIARIILVVSGAIFVYTVVYTIVLAPSASKPDTVPFPPDPEPIRVIELPLPPVAPNDTAPCQTILKGHVQLNSTPAEPAV
ncbi:hypothetical protein BDW69DRAFT_172703 [Aspergillus filifer]